MKNTKPLTIKVKELKKNLLETIIESDLHPILLGYVFEEVREELYKVIEKTQTYETETYKKSLEQKEGEEDGEN